MKWFERRINMELVERIDWETEGGHVPERQEQIIGCHLQFLSGHLHYLKKEDAQHLWWRLSGSHWSV